MKKNLILKVLLLIIFFSLFFNIKIIKAQEATPEVAAEVTSATSCTPFTDNFSGTTYTTNWSLWRTTAGKGTVTVSANQVKLAMPLMTSKQNIGLNSNKNFKGDFSVEITSKSVTVTVGKKEASTSFRLVDLTATGVTTNRQVMIYRLHGQNKLRWAWNQNPSNWTDYKFGDVDVAGLTNTKEIKFKFTRNGSAINMYYDLLGGAGYKLLKSIPNFTSSGLKIQLDQEILGPNFPASNAVFDSLKLTCLTVPTPTINPACVCTAQNVCSTQCVFKKYTGLEGVTYSSPIKCKSNVATLYPTPATATEKTDWCRRPNRTKGDATGEDNIFITDYYYFLQARYGGKIPAKINVDFNGDGAVTGEDRLIIVNRLITGQ